MSIAEVRKVPSHERADCERCGDLMRHKGSQRGALCARCRSEISEERREQIEDAWNQGFSLIEIAEALGISVTFLGLEIFRMRKAGWDVPYRYAVKR